MPAATPDALLEHLARSAQVDSAIERKRMLLIVNPYAATVSDRLRHLVVYALQGRYDVTAVDTQARGHATELCREAADEGYDVIVAFGGDGTVNEAANGLLGARASAHAADDAPDGPALTCLPGGSANVLCKMLGIPGEIVDATEHLLRISDDWRPRRIDLGRVNGRLFTFSSGMGLDADVVKRVDARPRLKARFGPWWFTTAGVTTFTREYVVRPPRLELEAGGETLRGLTALVQNGDPYTFFNNRPIAVADGARLDSGTFSGVMLERATPLDVPFIVWRLFSRRARIAKHRHVTAFEGVTDLVVRSADGRPVALQVDGDHVEDVVEARYELLPRALTVVA
jgi:diacylglycerol kinase family enzyme